MDVESVIMIAAAATKYKKPNTNLILAIPIKYTSFFVLEQ